MLSKKIFFCLFSLAIFTQSSLLFGLGKDLPLKVKDDIKNQIEIMIGTPPKGIPLLDTWTNWDDPKKWPIEYAYDKNKLFLDYMAPGMLRSIGEPTEPPKEIPQTFPIAFNYYLQNHRGASDHPRSFSSWREDGSVETKGVTLWSKHASKNVFFLRFFATGELLYYARYDIKKDAHITDYFDKRGNLVGTLISSDNGSGVTYQEGNREKDLNAYNQMINRLNQENSGDVPLPNMGVLNRS